MVVVVVVGVVVVLVCLILYIMSDITTGCEKIKLIVSRARTHKISCTYLGTMFCI